MTDTEEGTFSSGTVFEAKYRIERLLGRGGMGEVYAATHTLLDKLVAVKVLLPEYAKDAAMVSRMTREARAASATGHPNIALVTDMGWTGDRPFIVMEMIDGETLESRIARGPVPVDLALTWMDQILDALDAVHAKDLIHRDLKPANLMLTPSREGPLMIKVLDFGISKSTQADADTTGKTGTGQKATARGYVDRYVASFMGFFPAQTPRYGMLIVFDEPRGHASGGSLAAPVYAKVLRDILPTLKEGVQAVRVAQLKPAPVRTAGKTRLHDFRGLSAREASDIVIGSYHLPLRLRGSGRVFRQLPSPGTPLDKVESVELFLNDG